MSASAVLGSDQEGLKTESSDDVGSKDGYIHPIFTDNQLKKWNTFTNNNALDIWQIQPYLNIFSNLDQNWTQNRLHITFNNVQNTDTVNMQSLHETLMNSFINIPFADAQNPYSSKLQKALDLFHIWRKWKNDENGWKLKTIIKGMNVYSHSMTNEPIDIIKGEAIIPHSSPIVAGVLLNANLQKLWDKKLENVKRLYKISQNSSLMYVSIKIPSMFIAQRDMLVLMFKYAFEDGTILIGSTSVETNDAYPETQQKIQSLNENNINYVRMHTNLMMWYLRPDWINGNIQHTRCSYFTHMNLNGFMPAWLINSASSDIPASILKLRSFMNRKSNYDRFCESGVLCIPPYPLLFPCLDIHIPLWMIPESKQELYRNAIQISEQKESQPRNRNEFQMNGQIEVKNILVFGDQIRQRMKAYEDKFLQNKKQMQRLKSVNAFVNGQLKRLKKSYLKSERKNNIMKKLVIILVFALVIIGAYAIFKKKKKIKNR